MRKAIIAALAVLIAGTANAQLQSTVVAGSDNGTTRRIFLTDALGRLQVVGSASGGNVFGTDAINVVPTQPPTTYCLGSSTVPTSVTSGRVQYLVCDVSGRLKVTGDTSAPLPISDAGGSITIDGSVTVSGTATVSGTVAATQSGTWTVQPGNTANTTAWLVNGNVTAADGAALTNALKTNSLGSLYNGTTYDLQRAVTGASAGTGIGVAGVGIIPNSSANVGITPSVSTALESNRVLKASAGNLYSIAVNTTVDGYLMVFNATSAPADGAVTPLLCSPVAAGARVEVDHSVIPDVYSTGITAVFSTTGCFTKTASATAMFEGRTK